MTYFFIPGEKLNRTYLCSAGIIASFTPIPRQKAENANIYCAVQKDIQLTLVNSHITKFLHFPNEHLGAYSLFSFFTRRPV